MILRMQLMIFLMVILLIQNRLFCYIMIHYINIVLVLIALFLFYKISNKEGMLGPNIPTVNMPNGGIPNVPNDVVCMFLYAVGVDVDINEYLNNKCKKQESNLSPDDSNMCRV